MSELMEGFDFMYIPMNLYQAILKLSSGSSGVREATVPPSPRQLQPPQLYLQVCSPCSTHTVQLSSWWLETYGWNHNWAERKHQAALGFLHVPLKISDAKAVWGASFIDLYQERREKWIWEKMPSRLPQGFLTVWNYRHKCWEMGCNHPLSSKCPRT